MFGHVKGELMGESGNTSYSPAIAFVRYMALAGQWNKKLESKKEQITKRIERHEDFTDEGLKSYLALDMQRAEMIDLMAKNNLKALAMLRESDARHGLNPPTAGCGDREASDIEHEGYSTNRLKECE